MSIIFIEKSTKYLLLPLFKNNLKDAKTNILLQIIIGLCTYYLTDFLHKFKYNKYLIPMLRKFLVYFNSLIIIIIMTIIDLIIKDISTKKLTYDINYKSFDISINYYCLFSILTGFCASILIFIDHNITLKLLDNTHKLNQSISYHYDMIIISICIGLCSILGLPWPCAATIRTINYMSSLSVIEDEIDKEGIIYSHFVKITENRVPSLIIHIIIGVFFFYRFILSNIPESVIFGFILYMGTSSLTHNQIWDRIKLWVMRTSLYPLSHYIRNVKKVKVYYFTIIQILCIILLIILKSYVEVAFTFPLILVLYIYIRYKLIPKYYDKEELEYLDSDINISSNQIRESVLIG